VERVKAWVFVERVAIYIKQSTTVILTIESVHTAAITVNVQTQTVSGAIAIKEL
jgi:hypothetical protein